MHGSLVSTAGTVVTLLFPVLCQRIPIQNPVKDRTECPPIFKCPCPSFAFNCVCVDSACGSPAGIQ